MHDVSLAAGSSIWLSCRLQEVVIQFGFSTDGHRWQDFGPELDATRLSDDYGHGFSFTGSFFALACHDLSGAGLHADFDWFEYRQT